MPFCHHNGLRYYTFELFPHSMVQAVFTRQGGVSPVPWESLNVGGTVGDERQRVQENRKRSFAALGRSLESLFDVWQVLSADVVFAEAPRPPDVDHHKADIIFRGAPHALIVSAPPDAPCPAEDVVLALATFDLLAQSARLGTVWWGLLKMVLEVLPAFRGRDAARSAEAASS